MYLIGEGPIYHLINAITQFLKGKFVNATNLTLDKAQMYRIFQSKRLFDLLTALLNEPSVTAIIKEI